MMLASFFVTILTPLVGRDTNDRRLLRAPKYIASNDEYLGY